ncbi:centrosomal protein of 41 kDa A-like [Dendronephthya gigantea]|uniref:centrosomal protein of 41 kDa A-like n=1 Tax=Dendronephthya gigantea TaxID=151771 RepID=UPI00106AECC4|nr:centrosomal protein of 41 kDa A-like [Dendronephthya gigantea]
MSMGRRVPKKKDDIFNKKIPENPKYKHIRHTVDTGSSITRHNEKVELIKKNYKYRNDEIFKRMKVNTFAQLVLQVADVIYLENERDDLSTSGVSINYDNETPASEERGVESANENVPPLNLPPDETARHKTGSTVGTDTSRSTLQDLIRGVGEFDLKTQDEEHENNVDFMSARSTQSTVVAPDFHSLPYLLLDIRKATDEFDQSHIIGATNYDRANLSKTMNWCTEELSSFKSKEGKIIIVYDEDERYAPNVATTLVQRDFDNIFMLSGGMKVLNKRFPECFISGTLPQSCMPSPPPTRRATKKVPTKFLTPDNQHWEFFSRYHLQKMQDCLNEELLKQENSSRMSSRVSSRSSVVSSNSRLSTSSSTSSKKPWK